MITSTAESLKRGLNTQFKKGVSGNLKGRTKIIPQLDVLLADVLGEEKDGIEAAKAILDPKLTHDEYEELLTHHDIIPNEVLKSTHYKLIGAIDDHYKRLFNKYIELLLLKKEEGMLRSKRKIETPVVMFHEEIKSLTEELIRLLKPRQQ